MDTQGYALIQPYGLFNINPADIEGFLDYGISLMKFVVSLRSPVIPRDLRFYGGSDLSPATW